MAVGTKNFYYSSTSIQRLFYFYLAQPPAPITQGTLLSIRNLQIFIKSPSPKRTWDKFEAFVYRLLKYGLISPIEIEDQCFAIVKEEWPKDLLERFGSFLQGVIDSWKKRNPNNLDEFRNFTQDFETLEWLSWFLNTDEFENDINDFPELI